MAPSTLSGRGFGALIWDLTKALGFRVRRNRKKFYISLASIFILAMLVNSSIFTFTAGVKSRAIDFTIRHRVSSPSPDPKIVILDIDEHSLAEMSDTLGRWPWPRSVLAEAIATIADAGAKGIFLNVMLSDPDKNNPNADRIFQYVAAHTPNVAYPLVRLSEEGDSSSEVRFSMIGGKPSEYSDVLDQTISVLYPYFPATHDKLGVVNLSLSDDGILRSYAVFYEENGWLVPSAALRTMQVAGMTPDAAQNEGAEILLNWRNKTGDYRRVSFADAHAAMNGTNGFDWNVFRDAIVIIGSSAPGISTLKPTSASPVTLDNTITATAIDDMKNDSYLHQMPKWLNFIISMTMIVTLVFCFLTGISEAMISIFFVVAQSALLAASVLVASYFNYYIDFTDALLFGMAYFAIAKIYSLVDRQATRGAEMFSSPGVEASDELEILCVGVNAIELSKRQQMRLRNRLEAHFGLNNVLFVDYLFGDGHVFAEMSRDWLFIVIFPKEGEIRMLEQDGYQVLEQDRWISFSQMIGEHITAKYKLVKMQAGEATDTRKVRRFIGGNLISLAQEMLHA